MPDGATTQHHDVTNGVFVYAGYQFELDGKVVDQIAVDSMTAWVN
ncbi:MAG: hypothetical protein PHQ40_11055 [Anaerolineaceae bacterium]|nr:hypothetical protein [Anaerolineaceae bacterium]